MTGGLQQQARVAAHVIAGFQPFTGFDPAEGADPHLELSRDNPCRRHPGCDCVLECEVAVTVSAERRLDLAELQGETIVAVEPSNHGWRLRCANGAAIVIQSGCTFDRAGNPVIEP